MYNGERQDCCISQIIIIIIIIVQSMRMRRMRHIRHGRETYAGFWCKTLQERDVRLFVSFVSWLVSSFVGSLISM
jgi:hypothetical protein